MPKVEGNVWERASAEVENKKRRKLGEKHGLVRESPEYDVIESNKQGYSDNEDTILDRRKREKERDEWYKGLMQGFRDVNQSKKKKANGIAKPL